SQHFSPSQRPPGSPIFPYTTLFRSVRGDVARARQHELDVAAAVDDEAPAARRDARYVERDRAQGRERVVQQQTLCERESQRSHLANSRASVAASMVRPSPSFTRRSSTTSAAMSAMPAVSATSPIATLSPAARSDAAHRIVARSSPPE